MVVQEQLLTVEEFWEHFADTPYELVRGRIIEVSPSGLEVSATAVIVAGELHIYLKVNPIGILTGADGGYKLAPDTLRAPDVAFFRSEKLTQVTQPEKYVPFTPDLAIEVVSPNDSAAEVQDEVALYLESGAQQVWVFYPQRREVVVHYPDRTARTLQKDDVLDGGEILPNLRLVVNDLFPPAKS
jgi:Uma2 family endonuclease